MDGWEEGGKFSLPLSLSLAAAAAAASLSLLERQSIIGDVDQYSRSAPSSIGRRLADAQPEPAAVAERGSRCLTLENRTNGVGQGFNRAFLLLHCQIRPLQFDF